MNHGCGPFGKRITKNGRKSAASGGNSLFAKGGALMEVLSAQQPAWVSVWGGLEGAAAKQP